MSSAYHMTEMYLVQILLSLVFSKSSGFLKLTKTMKLGCKVVWDSFHVPFSSLLLDSQAVSFLLENKIQFTPIGSKIINFSKS